MLEMRGLMHASSHGEKRCCCGMVTRLRREEVRAQPLVEHVDDVGHGDARHLGQVVAEGAPEAAQHLPPLLAPSCSQGLDIRPRDRGLRLAGRLSQIPGALPVVDLQLNYTWVKCSAVRALLTA